MKFTQEEKVFSKLMNVTGTIKGYSNGCYAIEADDGYVWHLDEKAELIVIN